MSTSATAGLGDRVFRDAQSRLDSGAAKPSLPLERFWRRTMGRELKRVPLDFQCRKTKVWDGYLNRKRHSAACGRTVPRRPGMRLATSFAVAALRHRRAARCVPPERDAAVPRKRPGGADGSPPSAQNHRFGHAAVITGRSLRRNTPSWGRGVQWLATLGGREKQAGPRTAPNPGRRRGERMEAFSATWPWPTWGAASQMSAIHPPRSRRPNASAYWRTPF